MSSDDRDGKKVTLDTLVWLDIIVFSLTLAYALYNGTNFLVIQRRYNSFYLVTFYVLTVLVLGMRLAYFINTLISWDYKETSFHPTPGDGNWDSLAVLTYWMLGGL